MREQDDEGVVEPRSWEYERQQPDNTRVVNVLWSMDSAMLVGRLCHQTTIQQTWLSLR